MAPQSIAVFNAAVILYWYRCRNCRGRDAVVIFSRDLVNRRAHTTDRIMTGHVFFVGGSNSKPYLRILSSTNSNAPDHLYCLLLLKPRYERPVLVAYNKCNNSYSPVYFIANGLIFIVNFSNCPMTVRRCTRDMTEP